MIEDLIRTLITAVAENTKAVLANTAAIEAAGSEGNINPEPPKRRSKATAAVSEPEPEPAPAPAPAPAPEPVAAPKAVLDDTPHIPAAAEPGQPAAGEHVDVDEVISQINGLVKDALSKADDVGEAKDAWTAIRKGYGVERISDLRGEPAKLVKVLADAKQFHKDTV